MELIKIDKHSKDLKEIKGIILEAFPPEERPPFRFLIRRTGKPFVDFWGAYDEGRLVGITYVVHSEGAAYLFFLAIANKERGKGYGGALLEMMKEKYAPECLFLALEPLDPKAENYEQRVNRHNFYLRHGLKDMPYQAKEGSVV